MATAYEILETLYEGERSVVYRARKPDGTLVVLKELRTVYPPPAVESRFRRELDLTRRARGPGIVAASHIETSEGVLRMELEDFGGRSLAELMRYRRPSLRDVLEIGVALTDALGAVHARGVLHKDVTPGNVVRNRESGVLKLIDFGIAGILEGHTPDPRPLRSFEGTPAYMSPEQTGRMNRSLDHRSDYYSLGATLYHLATGQPPFDARDRLELVHAHIARRPVPAHERDARVPKPVSRILSTLLEKRAEDRYQSAAGLRHDLARCLQDLREVGSVRPFELRGRDVDPRLRVPDRLYGRDADIATLVDTFERVANGASEAL